MSNYKSYRDVTKLKTNKYINGRTKFAITFCDSLEIAQKKADFPGFAKEGKHAIKHGGGRQLSHTRMCVLTQWLLCMPTRCPEECLIYLELSNVDKNGLLFASSSVHSYF